MKVPRPLYAVLALGLAALACATVAVQNASDQSVMIEVTLPDDAYGTTSLAPGESTEYQASVGGPRHVDVIPDRAAYVEKLRGQRDDVVSVMALNPTLPLTDAGSAVWRKTLDLQSTIDDLAQAGTDCNGQIPEGLPDNVNYRIEVTVDYYKDARAWTCSTTEGPQ